MLSQSAGLVSGGLAPDYVDVEEQRTESTIHAHGHNVRRPTTNCDETNLAYGTRYNA